MVFVVHWSQNVIKMFIDSQGWFHFTFEELKLRAKRLPKGCIIVKQGLELSIPAISQYENSSSLCDIISGIEMSQQFKVD